MAGRKTRPPLCQIPAKTRFLPHPLPPAADCWFLTGPTAAGKTKVGIELAQRLNAEIVSLDSMALYQGMDIGTAKPTAEDRSRVPHHLLDLVPADRRIQPQRVH